MGLFRVNDNSNVRVDYSSEERTLKEKTCILFCQNSRIKAKQVCSFYNLPYGKHGPTINNYLSEFRSNLKYGHIPSEPKNAPHWRKWVWNKVLFCDKGRSEALSNGWKESRNRNGMLVFKDKLGSVGWFQNGTVLVLLKGCSNLAMAKTLFCRAFMWLSDLELSRYCEGSSREVGRHMVFFVGKEVPKFEIDYYKKSHGLRIFSDRSHTNAVEVEETEPLYLQGILRVQEMFKDNMNDHLVLVNSIGKAATSLEKAAVVLRGTSELQNSQKEICSSGEGFWRKFLRVMITSL